MIYNEDRNPINPTDWDSAEKTWGAVTGSFCGEWRYEGVINRLQFYITPGCTLYVYPRDAIMLGIRMEFTLDEFFDAGGVVTFTDRMAATLGIHAADIKVVQVYEGSTVVEFQVFSDPEDEDGISLEDVKSTFENIASGLSTFMGSPVLNAVSMGVAIVTPNTPEETNEEFSFNSEEGDPIVEREQKVKTEFKYKI